MRAHKEPMIPSKMPDYPWAEAASDIYLHLKAKTMYYPWTITPSISKSPNSRICQQIEALKGHFERHGIPKKLTTGCGSQYTSAEFRNFAKSYNFQHLLIKPKHPNANGEAEAVVKTAKAL